MMRIGLNAYVNRRGLSGSATGGRAIRAVLEGDHEFLELTPATGRSSRLGRVAGLLSWDLRRFSTEVRRHGCDLALNLANTGVVTHLPSITVMHDTMVLDHWRLFDPGYAAYARLTFGATARNSTVIVTPSEHSRASILQRWPQANVEVINWPNVKPQVAQVLHRPDTLRVVAIASADKHKRLHLAVEVVRKARERSGEPLELTLVCRSGNDWTAVNRAVAEANASADKPWVTLEASGMTDDALDSLLRSSLCLISTSLDEGFCLPLLEAASGGIPVVHTGRGAMPEVIQSVSEDCHAGSEIEEVESLTRAIISLLEDQAWREHADRALAASRAFTVARFERSWRDLLTRL